MGGAAKPPSDPLPSVRLLTDHPLGEFLRRLDIGHLVHQGESLQGRVGPGPLHRADLTTRHVKKKHAGGSNGPADVGVEAPTVEILAVAALEFPPLLNLLPEAGGLVGLDARASQLKMVKKLEKLL